MQGAQSELFEVNPTLNSSSKICSKCNERKPIEDFHKRKVSRDGLNHVCKTCASVYAKEKYNDIDYRLSKVVTNATKRAKKNNLPIDIDVEYLKTIMTEKCPVFDIKLNWDTSGEGITDNSPSLDRVIPELGYVKHNVVFISKVANSIKQDVTETELYKVADWLHDKRKEVLRAVKEQSASVPTEHTRESEDNFELRAVHGARTRKDCDGSHHHRGEPEGCGLGDSTKEGCRICMGSGMLQVDALKLFEDCETYGLTETEVRRLAKFIGCVCYQS